MVIFILHLLIFDPLIKSTSLEEPGSPVSDLSYTCNRVCNTVFMFDFLFSRLQLNRNFCFVTSFNFRDRNEKLGELPEERKKEIIERERKRLVWSAFLLTPTPFSIGQFVKAINQVSVLLLFWCSNVLFFYFQITKE